jgi:hypothetical protein
MQNEFELFEQLPAEIRAAMRTSVNDWDANEVAKYLAHHSVDQTIKWLRRRDQDLMRKQRFYVAWFVNELTVSSYVSHKVAPLR